MRLLTEYLDLETHLQLKLQSTCKASITFAHFAVILSAGCTSEVPCHTTRTVFPWISPPPPPPSLPWIIPLSISTGLPLQYCRVPKNNSPLPDGPSLERSYFSRLQPISFLFFNPSASHVGKLVACTRAGNAVEMFWTVEMESFWSQQWRRSSCLHSKRCLRVVRSFLAHFSSLGSFLFLNEIPAWPFFGKPFFGTRQYCIGADIEKITPLYPRLE